MAPRTLRRGPDYTLDVKTRVPTGSVQRTQQVNRTPASDPYSPLAEGLGFFAGLAKIGYSLKDFFNQNNQRNADRGWGDMLPEVQKTYNLADTRSVDQLKAFNEEALKTYQDHINGLDENQKTKDKMLKSLSDYSSRKMEQLYGTGLAEDKVANITNTETKIQAFIKEEDFGAIKALLIDASLGEDAWLDVDTAIAREIKAIDEVYYETAKNDLAELGYKEAYDIITAQGEDGEGNPYYINYPDLTGAERSILEKTITQEGTLEEQRKSVATYEATNIALNSLFSEEVSVSDLYRNGVEGLDATEIANIINTYEGQQVLTAARKDKTAADLVWGKINTGKYTTEDDVLNHYDPNLSEKTRRGIANFFETGEKPFDPVATQDILAEAHRQNLMRMLAEGMDPFLVLNSALKLIGETNKDTGLKELDIDRYNKILNDAQDKSALSSLTTIVKGFVKDPRFKDPETGLQNNKMYEEFVRLYPDMFYANVHETDPSKQLNIDQFREMANTLIDTISNEELQEDFNKISRSNKSVGTGLLTSWGSNDMEDAITNLNSGMYDAMRLVEPEAWSLFKRKMQVQYEEIKGKPYDGFFRMYKDKIPVFMNDDGVEEMIVIVGGIPQTVSLDKGINEYKNLALGYNIGERNAEDETMLKNGWFRITYDKDNPDNSTVVKYGKVFGGELMSPKGFNDYYIVYESANRQSMEIRPYNGDPNSDVEIANAIKLSQHPEITIEEEDESRAIVDKAIIDTTPLSYYIPQNVLTPKKPEEMTNADKVRERTRIELEKRGIRGLPF